MDKPIDINPHNLLSLLLNAYYQVDEELQKSLQDKGWMELTHSQSIIFLNLGEGRNRVSDIAQHMGVSKQAISRSVNELADLGLITMKADEKDKRARIIELTNKGTVISIDATESLKKIEDKIDSKLGKKKANQLRELLSKLDSN